MSFGPQIFYSYLGKQAFLLKHLQPFRRNVSFRIKVALERPPKIQSPLATVSYVIRAHKTIPETIPFLASTDTDVKTLFWFVDGSYIGQSPPSVPLDWPARNGSFTVTAVDDSGRATTSTIRVLLEN